MVIKNSPKKITLEKRSQKKYFSDFEKKNQKLKKKNQKNKNIKFQNLIFLLLIFLYNLLNLGAIKLHFNFFSENFESDLS